MTREERIADFRSLSPLEEHTTNELVSFLNKAGFFDAPASTKYHGAYEGGLYDHSREVYKALRELTSLHNLGWERYASPFIVAFLHDLCKADQYVKTENGYEYRKDCLLTGHGEKSVMICASLPLWLTMEEVTCIRYHMGAFVDSKEWSSYTGAIHQYPNVFWTHTADMIASHLRGV